MPCQLFLCQGKVAGSDESISGWYVGDGGSIGLLLTFVSAPWGTNARGLLSSLAMPFGFGLLIFMIFHGKDTHGFSRGRNCRTRPP